MGSSALYHMAKQKMNVLGLERFEVSHGFGSSHGLSRIIRLAYYEHPSYVDLLKRAFALWGLLEIESKTKLFTRTGSLDIGFKDSRTFVGSKESCRVHDLDHTILNREQLVGRFAGWQSIPANDDLYAVYQPTGGVLNPEKCNLQHIKIAKAYGARVSENETVEDVVIYGQNDILIKTSKSEYLTSKVVLSPGAWLSDLIDRSKSLSSIKMFKTISNSLKPERNVVIWYKSQKPELYMPQNFPVFNLNYKNDEHYYGFPIIDSGLYEYEKVGFKIGKYHHRKEEISTSMLDRNADWRMQFSDKDRACLNKITETLLKDAYGEVLHQVACIFTNSPDKHFIIDCSPTNSNVIVISACSGHGFKFSSVMGEILAHYVTNGSVSNYPFGKVDWFKVNNRFS